MNYKLAPTVLKRYEPELDTYYFYNAQKQIFWHCDYSMGEIISCLDGNISLEEIIDVIVENNPELLEESIKSKIKETFDFLYDEGYIVC